PLGAVVGQDRDVIAGAHAELGEHARGRAHAIVVLAPGELAPHAEPLLADRDLVRAGARVDREQPGQRLIERGLPLRRRVRAGPGEGPHLAGRIVPAPGRRWSRATVARGTEARWQDLSSIN